MRTFAHRECSVAIVTRWDRTPDGRLSAPRLDAIAAVSTPPPETVTAVLVVDRKPPEGGGQTPWYFCTPTVTLAEDSDQATVQQIVRTTLEDYMAADTCHALAALVPDPNASGTASLSLSERRKVRFTTVPDYDGNFYAFVFVGSRG